MIGEFLDQVAGHAIAADISDVIVVANVFHENLPSQRMLERNRFELAEDAEVQTWIYNLVNPTAQEPFVLSW